MESLVLTYLTAVQALQRRIAEENAEQLAAGGEAIADQLAQDRLVHVIGTGGHSAIGAEEVHHRAGGFVQINAILDAGLSLSNGSLRSGAIERTPGYATALLKYNDVRDGDLLIINNAYGINAATIDSALYCREHGVRTIGLTSIELQRELPPGHASRHPSGQNLCDLVDIVVDTKVPMGDAIVTVQGVTQKVGPCSTLLNVFAMNALMIEATAALARRGIDPKIWKSGNAPGGDEANQAFVDEFKYRIKKL